MLGYLEIRWCIFDENWRNGTTGTMRIFRATPLRLRIALQAPNFGCRTHADTPNYMDWKLFNAHNGQYKIISIVLTDPVLLRLSIAGKSNRMAQNIPVCTHPICAMLMHQNQPFATAFQHCIFRQNQGAFDRTQPWQKWDWQIIRLTWAFGCAENLHKLPAQIRIQVACPDGLVQLLCRINVHCTFAKGPNEQRPKIVRANLKLAFSISACT
jgi:hypothetical protein